MADVLKEVRIMFEGTDNVSTVIDGLSGKLDDFGGQVQKVTQPLADMAEKVLKVEAALAALAAGGIVLAINEAGKFDTQFREITTLFEASPESVNKFKEALIDFASNSLTPLEQVGKATYEAISAGIEWGKSIEFMTEAERLNVAGKGELQSTTLALAGAINAYGGDVSKAADFSDALFTAVKVGNLTLPDLAAGLGNVASIAATAGIPFSDLNAAIAALTSYGVPASEAMTQIRAAIVSILAPANESKEAAEKLGIQFDAEALKANGLQGMLQLLYEKTGGNVDIMKDFIPRIEGLNAALVLGNDSGGKFADALQQMETRAGATAAAYEKMSVSFDNVNNRIINAFKALLVEVGTPMLDEYSKIGAGIQSIFSNLKIEVDKGTFAPILELIESFGNELGEDLKKIAAAMPEAFEQVNWNPLTDALRNLGEQVKGLFVAVFGDVDLTTADGLATAIQKVVNGVSALTNTAAGILQSWQPFVEMLSGMAEKYSNLDQSQQTFAGNILGFAQGVNKIVENFDLITGSLTALSGAMTVIAGTNIINLISAFSSVGTAATGLGTILLPLAEVFGALFIIGGVGTAIESVVPSMREMREAAGDLDETFANAVYDFDALTRNIGENGEEIAKSKDIWTELVEAIDAMPTDVKTEISAPGAEITKDEIDEIVKAFAEVGEKKTVTVAAEADTASIEKVKNIIIEELPDGRVILTQTDYDKAALDNTKAAVEKALPAEKIMELKLEGEIQTEIAKIETSAKTAQAAFEYKAKVDVAEVEQVFETIRNQSDNITKMFESTGDVLSELAASLSDLSGLAKLEIFELMEQESKRRDALLVEQQKLTAAQIKYLEARTKAMESGQGIITIEANGLEAELELVLQKIIQLTQVRANEEGLNFLLGVS